MNVIAINIIEDAIKDLEDSISEKQSYIELIKAIDWDKPITENEWHVLCRTSLRTSKMLARLVKNTFPKAENIEVLVNYVRFELFGFKCFLPTSRVQGIEVHTGWYRRDEGVPNEENKYYGNVKAMKNYFDALDNNESWKLLFKYRLPNLSYYRTWVKFLMWFGWYKWKDPKREEWEKEFERCEANYERRVFEHCAKRRYVRDKAKFMIEKLIPELSKFTTIVRTYKDNTFSLMDNKIENIIEWEGLNKNQKENT